MRLVLFAAAIVAGAVLLEVQIAADNVERAGFEQVGYFRDKYSHRIFTIRMPEGADEKAVRAHAEGLKHTKGNLTWAHYYATDADVPAGRMSYAETADKAMDVIFSDPDTPLWRYVFIRYGDGSTLFGNCVSDPQNGPCAKE